MDLNNHSIRNPAGSRVVFLDNLRYLFVIGVVLQHTCSAYIPSSASYDMSWWPVTDRATPVALWLLQFCDAFLMQGLFFIAGYFAIPSIQKRGTGSFIKGKLKRLGVPWLVCNLFICPILPFLYHYTRDNLRLTRSYWETWLSVMTNAAQFDFRVLPSMNDVMRNDLFYQRYMWFVGLLLALFLLFSLVYTLKKSWFQTSAAQITFAPRSSLSTVKLLVSVGSLTFLGSSILIFLSFALSDEFNPGWWFTIGNLIQFQIIKIVSHIIYFIMGVVAYRQKWIDRGRLTGHPKTLLTFFIINLASFYIFIDLMTHNVGIKPEIVMGGFWISYNFFTISSLGVFMALALRYWNTPTALHRMLAVNSYYIYLSHYPYVFLFQFILLLFPGIDPLLKLAFVFLSATFFSYMTSQYLIRPYPKTTITVMVALFLIMVTSIRV